MNPFTRRLATIALGGVLAVGSLSGCGIFGTALDCGKLAKAANDVNSNIDNPDALKTAIGDMEKAAQDIDDAELKQAVEDFTEEANKSLEILEKSDTDPAAVADMEQPDTSKMQDAASTINDKCSGS